MPLVSALPLIVALTCSAALACGGRDRSDPAPELARDDHATPAAPPHGQGRGTGHRPAAPPAAATGDRFPELAGLPRVRPVRVIELATRPDVPRFEVHGPLLIDDLATDLGDDLAIVATSQLGFAAVQWRTGKLAWTRGAGAHVAPPVRTAAGELVLIGDCAVPPAQGEPSLVLLGCARVLGPTGNDRSDSAIAAPPALATAMRGPGRQRTWPLDERRIAWQRGEHALTLDLASGRADDGAAPEPPLTVRHGEVTLQITLDEDGQLRARRQAGPAGKTEPAWQARGRFAAILGVIPGRGHETPVLRLLRPSTVRSVGASTSGTSFDVLDVDAMTASGGTAATPAPGIQLLASASGPGNAAALVMRLDRSLRRDYVIAYTRTAQVAWVYPLPDALRTDAVGVAVAADGVLVFHDGDTLTVLPAIE